ncbi:MAG: tetratricopeptide repeat protein [Flavobacteriales bacterium]
MIKTFFFCAAVSLSVVYGFSQSENDSLRIVWEDETQEDSVRFKALDDFCWNNLNSRPDSSLKVAQVYFELAEEKQDSRQRVEAYDMLGITNSLAGNHDKSIDYLKLAVIKSKGLNDNDLYGAKLMNLGSAYYHNADYKEAISYFTESLPYFEKPGKERSQADVLNNLGLIYESIALDELALDYLEQALRLYEQIGVDQQAGNIWLNMSYLFWDQNKVKKSREYVSRALEILESQGNKRSLADCYFLLSKHDQKNGNIQSALENNQRSLEFNLDIDYTVNIIDNKILQAQLLKDSDLEQAQSIISNVGTGYAEQFVLRQKVDIFDFIYQYHKEREEPREALDALELRNDYNDSLLIQNDKISIVSRAIQSDYDSKLLKNQIESERIQSDLELKQLNRIYLISFAGLLILGAVYWYFRKRVATQTQEKNRLLEEIEAYKSAKAEPVKLAAPSFELVREKLEEHIERKLNETDWTVLTILLDDPVISNKGIAEKAFLSVDGIGSSLRRMYQYFEIKESKYKKISLLMTAMKLST